MFVQEDVDFDSDATEPDTGNYSDAEDVDDGKLSSIG